MPPFERELRGFEAALVDRGGDAAAAAALAEEAIADSRAADDPLTEIWARLVAVTIDIRDGRVDEAGRQLDLAQRRAAAIDDAWWGGPLARSRALLAAHLPVRRRLASVPSALAQRHRAVRPPRRPGRAHPHPLHRGGRRRGARPRATTPPPCCERRRTCPPSPCCPRSTPTACATCHRTTTARRRWCPPSAQALAVLTDDDRADDGRRRRPPPPAEAARLQREGDVWALTFAGRTVRVRDLKGLGDLAVLLRRAGEDVHCLELMGATDVGGSGTGPALDERARREYQARILDLQRDVDEAHEANDPVRAERAELELDALVTELSKAFGLGGRARSGGSSVERARTAVTFRIRAAIKKVAEQHEVLGTHLAHSVRTGTWCAYRPEREVRWVVDAT